VAQLKASILKLFSSDDVRIIEQQLVASGFSTDQLMQWAGDALFDAAVARWPSAKRWLVLCGAGNNGGDGFAVARLAHQAGIDVCCAVAKQTGLPVEAQYQCDQAIDEGVNLIALEVLSQQQVEKADLIIDALLGIGFEGGCLREPFARVVHWANSGNAPILSADVPSGLDATRGGDGGIEAVLTVSFIAYKRGMLTGRAKRYVGELQLVMHDLVARDGLPKSSVARLTDSDLTRSYRAVDVHKGDQGTVNVIGGVEGMGGAAIMAAEAAYSMGAGRTLCTTAESTVTAGLSRSPEIMYRAAQSANAHVEPTVIVVGPGMGRDGMQSEVMWQIAVAANTSTVIDADGLYWLKKANVNPFLNRSVITPHAGEAAHLLNWSVEEVECDRYHAAAELGERYSAVVILKGAGTIVHCNLSKQAVVVDAGTPALAVGGSGDTLAGAVGALIAQGYSLFDAACQGALIHAVAAQRWADDCGVVGLRPSQLLVEMVKVFNGR